MPQGELRQEWQQLALVVVVLGVGARWLRRLCLLKLIICFSLYTGGDFGPEQNFCAKTRVFFAFLVAL